MANEHLTRRPASGPARMLRGGVDLGGTKIQAVVVDAKSMILGQGRRPTPTVGGPADVVAEMAETLREAAEAAGCATADLLGVGVGAPGAASFETGVLAHAPNLPGWDDPYPLAAELGKRVGAPVLLGNDVGVAVDAEFQLGAGKPFDSILGIWWGTGVGGGIILDGRPWHGRGAAGEFGHTIVKLGGRAEPKGLRGTVEAYAGRAAMEAQARKLVARGGKTKLFEIMEKKGRTRLASGVWAKALEERDPVAVGLVGEALEALGAGAASVVNLLDIEAVVIGGGLGTRLGQPYADRIAAAMAPHLFQPEKAPPVLAARLGDLGGAIGGALLVPEAGAGLRPVASGGSAVAGAEAASNVA
jgi:glucokinase